jgi:hypothetical protein
MQTLQQTEQAHPRQNTDIIASTFQHREDEETPIQKPPQSARAQTAFSCYPNCIVRKTVKR